MFGEPALLAVATVDLKAVTKHAWFAPAVGAALTVLCGLALHEIPAGEKWENASYDYLFRFGKHVTSDVVVIEMDNTSYEAFKQTRGKHWDRSLHADLIHKLAGARGVVLDAYLQYEEAPKRDAALVKAIREQGHVILMGKLNERLNQRAGGFQPEAPADIFAQAAKGIGIGEADPSKDDYVVRTHWPLVTPDQSVTNLAWAAAVESGASLSSHPEERWLRYYGNGTAWTTISYQDAASEGPGYFSNKVVFIGQAPEDPDSRDYELDKFNTPFTRRTGKAVGGVEIHATTYLNLVRGDWLRRVPSGGEISLLILPAWDWVEHFA